MPPILASFFASDAFIQLVLAIILGVLLPKATQYIKTKTDDKVRGHFELAMSNAIRAGINAIAKTQNRTPFSILLAVANDHAVREQVMLFARDYLQTNVPHALERLGIGNNVSDMIVARIDPVVETMATSLNNTAAQLLKGTYSEIPIEQVAKNFAGLGSDKPTPTVADDANQQPALDLK